MKLNPEHIYHIYNRGNNSQKIFFKEENYLFFLKKLRKEVRRVCTREQSSEFSHRMIIHAMSIIH